MLDFLDYMSGLNPDQKLAVETTEGPLLVLAGAGTGKTRVLTSRIAHLVATGKSQPGEILTTTFTNKAAREMKTRLRDMLGPTADRISWLGTFHAISARILRSHAELVGLKSNLTILGADDQIRLLKKVIQAANLDDKQWTPKLLASIINGWKNKGLTPGDIVGPESNAFGNKGKQLYLEYQNRLQHLNVADYGDLLLFVVTMWRKHPDLLTEYQSRFRYILVDEYQDTNVIQYLWLKLIAAPSGNIACVGDDDQSIYGWRGAEVENILRFEHNFPGAKVIRLERNYRSTKHILTVASHLISHNSSRLGKSLFTEDVSEQANKVSVAHALDSAEEAKSISEVIESLRKSGHALDQMAILVRASSQMREFEDRFVSIGLPYRIVGGPRFYDRAEIRDALAYFRCVVQPSDDLAFERIINTPSRGLGNVTLQKIRGLAQERNIPLLEASRELLVSGNLHSGSKSALKRFTDQLQQWSSMLSKTPHSDLATIILEESGYLSSLKNDVTPKGESCLDNLKELTRSVSEYEDFTSFLEHISLVTDREDPNERNDVVNLMTLHAAKGLEFDTVFLPGWEEGLFPHQRSIVESGSVGLEEERRLAYVGLTRARKTAMIWFAMNRQTYGGFWQASVPSRFLGELLEDHISFLNGRYHYAGIGEESQVSPSVYGGYNYPAPGEEGQIASSAGSGYRHKRGHGRINRLEDTTGSDQGYRSSHSYNNRHKMDPDRLYRGEETSFFAASSGQGYRSSHQSGHRINRDDPDRFHRGEEAGFSAKQGQAYRSSRQSGHRINRDDPDRFHRGEEAGFSAKQGQAYRSSHQREMWSKTDLPFSNKSGSNKSRNDAYAKRTTASPASRKEDNKHRAGARVFSRAFGSGVITGVLGDKLRVEFDDVGPKSIHRSYVDLV